MNFHTFLYTLTSNIIKQFTSCGRKPVYPFVYYLRPAYTILAQMAKYHRVNTTL